MKKVIFMVAMALMSVCSFANEVSIANYNIDADKVIEKYDLNINRNKLADALKMTNEQMEPTNDVIKAFEDNMAFASSIKDEEVRDKVVINSINNNLKTMRYFLDEKQYKRYNMLLNLTLRNRGFDMVKICK